MIAAKELAPEVGTAVACRALEVPRATYYRHLSGKGNKPPRNACGAVFRLNEENCAIDTTNRLESLVKGVIGKRLTYKMLKEKAS
jgi:hypothetical protein